MSTDTPTRRPAAGFGLPPTKAKPTAADVIDLRPVAPAADVGVLRVLPVDQLRPADDNVRRDLGGLTELAESIAGQGVLQALLVNDAGDGTWLIVAGHRRHAAARLAGLAEVPCVVRSLSEVARLEAMIVENIQREGLSPLEEADGLRRLAELTGLGQRALGARLGRSQAHVSKRLALLGLPEAAQQALTDGTITLEGAQALARLKDHPGRIAETLKMAKSTHKGWSITHVVDMQLEQVAIKAKIDAAVAAVPAGVRHQLVDHFSTYGSPYRLLGRGAEQVGLREAKHRGLRCHVVVIDKRTGSARVCCDKPKDHPEYKAPSWERGTAGRSLSAEEKRERAESKRLNSELKAAAARRLVRLQAMAQMTAESLAGEELLEDLVEAWLGALGHENKLLLAAACEILRLEPKGEVSWDVQPFLIALRDRKARPWQAVAVALTLAAGEWQVRAKHGWDSPAVAALYRRLRANGYEPCADETALLKAGRGC